MNKGDTVYSAFTSKDSLHIKSYEVLATFEDYVRRRHVVIQGCAYDGACGTRPKPVIVDLGEERPIMHPTIWATKREAVESAMRQARQNLEHNDEYTKAYEKGIKTCQSWLDEESNKKEAEKSN